MTLRTAVGATVAVAVLLAGCGGGASPAQSSSSAAAPASAPPITITQQQNGTTVDLQLGQEAIIDVPTDPGVDVFVTASDERVLSVEQAEGEGAVTASPSVIARASGSSLVTVELVNDSVDAAPATALTFTVQVP